MLMLEIVLGFAIGVFILLQKNKDKDTAIVKCVIITHMAIGLAFSN